MKEKEPKKENSERKEKLYRDKNTGQMIIIREGDINAYNFLTGEELPDIQIGRNLVEIKGGQSEYNKEDTDESE